MSTWKIEKPIVSQLTIVICILQEKYTYLGLYYAVGIYYNTVFYTQENVFLVLKRSIENDQLSLYSIIIIIFVLVGQVSFTVFVNSRTVEPMPNCIDIIAPLKKYLVGMRAVFIQNNKKPIANIFLLRPKNPIPN